jgi:lycopene cyclase domain-containing protein
LNHLGHATYLVFELLWALPVLALQAIVGGRELVARGRVLVLAVLLPTIYLSIADSVAIAHGIWVIHGHRTTGFRLGNLPIEEVIFFLLTNAMVAQSVMLVRDRSRRAARSGEIFQVP